MGFKSFISKQAENPTGFFGRYIMSKIFDLGNAALNSFMVEQMRLEKNTRILEIGFGTGRLINKLTRDFEVGVVEGIERSETMVNIAIKKNKKLINQDIVIIKLGDFETVEYDNEKFDLICSANTIYFWDNPQEIIKKTHRILKPGGQLILAYEDKQQQQDLHDLNVFRIYSENEVKDIVQSSGYKGNIEIVSKKKGLHLYHCCVAVK